MSRKFILKQPDKALHLPPDASITERAYGTAAPDTGASELNRYVAS